MHGRSSTCGRVINGPMILPERAQEPRVGLPASPGICQDDRPATGADSFDAALVSRVHRRLEANSETLEVIDPKAPTVSM